MSLHKVILSLLSLSFFISLSSCSVSPAIEHELLSTPNTPYIVVLGIAQDGGVPQTGSFQHLGWTTDAYKESVVSLGLLYPAKQKRWLFEATPDFREQLFFLQQHLETPNLVDGIFLTHAHIGHYTGLMFLGHESLGAKGIPVFTMLKMHTFLENNGPWSQLVKYENIVLQELQQNQSVQLDTKLSVTPILVPHRQEFSEVVGYRIEGPNKKFLFIPDIDSWETWDTWGVHIEDEIAKVDYALLDATFFANGEIPGRDMTGFPHPFITHSMNRFKSLPSSEKAKIYFIHFNHTNPVLDKRSEAYQQVLDSGFNLSFEGQIFTL